jgi:hypothetical protein
LAARRLRRLLCPAPEVARRRLSMPRRIHAVRRGRLVRHVRTVARVKRAVTQDALGSMSFGRRRRGCALLVATLHVDHIVAHDWRRSALARKLHLKHQLAAR